MAAAHRATDGAIFHGWHVVGAAFAVLFLAYGLQFSYGVFVTSMASDLGWSRAQTALPYSIYVFLYSVLSAVTGRATDRFGPRIVIRTGAVLLGLGWGLSALIAKPWHLNVTLGLVAALGMSVAWVPCNATVARWFTRRRGTAVAIASTGASFGNFIVPALVAALIPYWGWRMILGVLATLSALCIFIVARYMVRDPEALGLWPDGDQVSPPHAELTGGQTEYNGYGLWFRRDVAGQILSYAKEGINVGASAFLRAFPPARITAVLLSNLEDGVWQPMHFVAAQIEAGEWGRA